MDNNELKIQALLERIAEQARTYENIIADLRVTLTNMSNKLQQFEQEVEHLREQTWAAGGPEEAAASFVPDVDTEGQQR